MVAGTRLLMTNKISHISLKGGINSPLFHISLPFEIGASLHLECEKNLLSFMSPFWRLFSKSNIIFPKNVINEY